MTVEGPVSSELYDQERPPIPDHYFAIDHVVLKTPSIADSLKWAKAAGFVAHEGGKHGDGLTENVLIRFKDGSYLELVSFVEPSPDEEAKKGHWWDKKVNGVCDWCLMPRGQTEHLETLGGEEAYHPPRHGSRKTKDGKELKWIVTFPAIKPRGELPFMCEDVSPREWRVPRADEHPNGAVGVRAIQLLSKPTRMNRLFNPLVAVLGRASQEPMGTSSDKTATEYPPRDRALYLSTPVEPKQARVEVKIRDAATEEEAGWLARAGEGIYEVLVACEGREELGDSLEGLSGLRLAPLGSMGD